MASFGAPESILNDSYCKTFNFADLDFKVNMTYLIKNILNKHDILTNNLKIYLLGRFKRGNIYNKRRGTGDRAEGNVLRRRRRRTHIVRRGERKY